MGREAHEPEGRALTWISDVCEAQPRANRSRGKSPGTPVLVLAFSFPGSAWERSQAKLLLVPGVYRTLSTTAEEPSHTLLRLPGRHLALVVGIGDRAVVRWRCTLIDR